MTGVRGCCRLPWVLLLAVCLAAGLLPAPAAAEPDVVWVSPGIKLAYTFGRGFTFGLEVSVIWAPYTWEDLQDRPVGLGFAINLDTDFDEFFKLHAGFQATSLFFGLETGPTLVADKNGTFFGLGLTPWVSSYCIPYYTYTYVFGATPNYHELGVYLKLHLTADGRFAGDTHHHDLD